VLRAEFPRTYAARLHLRPAPLLHLLRENPYPRVAATPRIRSLRSVGDYFGPFASRTEAEQYANDSLDFFLLRRCTPELNPDPSFPGCVYSEMKMCLAPCFKGCSDERYAKEAASVGRYLESGGRSLLVELGRARDEASARLEFEAAAAAHARLEKLKALQARLREIVHPIHRLNGLLLQPSHLAGHIALFPIAGGMFAGPLAFDVSPRTQSSQSRGSQQERGAESMEARIKDALRATEAPAPASAHELMEHLAILKRWYYRSTRVGEVFFEDEHGSLPMRRVVRAVGRVFKGEKPAGDLSETAGDYWAFRGKEAGLQ
jgi:excinuclease ABC subunit C